MKRDAANTYWNKFQLVSFIFSSHSRRVASHYLPVRRTHPVIHPLTNSRTLHNNDVTCNERNSTIATLAICTFLRKGWRFLYFWAKTHGYQWLCRGVASIQVLRQLVVSHCIIIILDFTMHVVVLWCYDQGSWHICTKWQAEKDGTERESSNREGESMKLPWEPFLTTENDGENIFFWV